MGKHGQKRGFTIVELVIVIGVIGILSAILIPTFINLNKKAQDSSDSSFAKNANTALTMGNKKHRTMSEAIQDVVANSDIDVDGFKASSGNILVWDSVADRFAVVDEALGVNKVVYAEGGCWTRRKTWSSSAFTMTSISQPNNVTQSTRAKTGTFPRTQSAMRPIP